MSDPHADTDPIHAVRTGTGRGFRVDAEAIPRLRAGFERALDRLRPQVHDAITDLRVRPWAGDPVSDAAAERFNETSVDGAAGAYHALRSCQEQLRAAADTLRTTHQEYQDLDADGGARFRMTPDGGA